MKPILLSAERPPLPEPPKIQILCESCLRDRNKWEACHCSLIYGVIVAALTIVLVCSWGGALTYAIWKVIAG